MRYIIWMLWLISFSLYAQEPMVEFHFVDVPLSLAVENLAEQAGKDVKVAESVKKNITLSSDPIPWNQALTVIKSHFQLQEKKVGETLWLVPLLRQQQKQAQKKKKRTLHPQQPSRRIAQPSIPTSHAATSGKRASGYVIHFYRMKHYSAAKIVSILTDKRNNLFEFPVYAQAEIEHNAVMVRAQAITHRHIQELIENLDIPNPQINISSRVVIAKNTASKELGVRLGTRSLSNYWGIAGGSQGAFSQTTTGLTPSFGKNLIVDLGLNQKAAGRATLGFNDGTSLIELELQALESSGKIDVIASPQVTVLSGSEAVIATGTEIPYSQVVDNNVDVFFKEALLELVVTPTRTGAGKIHMNIAIRLDNLGQQYSGIPSIDTNRLSTQVTLESKETLVLGGIFKTVNTTSEEKVPLLGDIPILGALFRHSADLQEKAELLVFITPDLGS